MRVPDPTDCRSFCPLAQCDWNERSGTPATETNVKLPVRPRPEYPRTAPTLSVIPPGPGVSKFAGQGAFKVLGKPANDQSLWDALRLVMDRYRERVASQADRNKLRRIHAQMSARQRRLFRQMNLGISNKQIASQLDVSRADVRELPTSHI